MCISPSVADSWMDSCCLGTSVTDVDRLTCFGVHHLQSTEPNTACSGTRKEFHGLCKGFLRGSVRPVHDVLVGFGLVRRWWAASFSTLVGHDVRTVAMISTAAMAQMANVYHVASRFVRVSTSFEEKIT
jgi:hypothetical protein